jgi:hypothetical protein
VVRVDQPLVLISQAQRSGGTLLLRLFDDHPECHVVPFQLRGIDEAAKKELADAEAAWRALYDPKLAERARAGHRHRKGAAARRAPLHRFDFDPTRQRALYDACVAELDRPSARRLLDCYLTAYLNAWRGYRNLAGGKRWVVAFEPAVARSLRRREAFLTTYPDGRVVSIVRDPWSWYASARRWEPRWRERERALDHWCRVAGGTLKWLRLGEGRVRLLTFEALLTRTEQTMRQLAGWLGIEFRPELLRPTFNGEPTVANSSFADVALDVSARPLERARGQLSADDAAYIEARAGELYARLARKAAKAWPQV